MGEALPVPILFPASLLSFSSALSLSLPFAFHIFFFFWLLGDVYWTLVERAAAIEPAILDEINETSGPPLPTSMM